jgi:hypothetical protein
MSHVSRGKERTALMFGRLPWLAGVLNPQNPDAELIGQVVMLFYFAEPNHRMLFEGHSGVVIGALRQLGRPLDSSSVVAHFAPERLEDLSYELPGKQGVVLRHYLAKLEGWVSRYLADADEFSLQTLRQRGRLPELAA